MMDHDRFAMSGFLVTQPFVFEGARSSESEGEAHIQDGSRKAGLEGTGRALHRRMGLDLLEGLIFKGP